MRYLSIFLLGLALVLLGCKVLEEVPEMPVNETIEEKPAPEPIEAEPASEALGTPEEVKGLEVIVSDTAITPKNNTLKAGGTVNFRAEGSKRHKIACYSGSNRISLSEDLRSGDVFPMPFNESGQYTCLDIIYGFRSSFVVAEEFLSPILGSVIGAGLNRERLIILGPAAIIAVLALYAFLSRKRA
ncbi:MAG TPA: hypothetical protein VJI46_07190 [Candidatus Nanoarchaeia archaeon]|nr:hypothetical protein [Candidatus Nanoarchaeia archaeon]